MGSLRYAKITPITDPIITDINDITVNFLNSRFLNNIALWTHLKPFATIVKAIYGRISFIIIWLKKFEI